MTIGQSQRRIRLFITPILSNADKANRSFPRKSKNRHRQPPDPEDADISCDTVHSHVELKDAL